MQAALASTVLYRLKCGFQHIEHVFWMSQEHFEVGSSRCKLTGTKFGTLTNHRHHCRFCGLTFISEACDYKQALPDLGWYESTRVCNECIGIPSCDPLEDVFLLLDKKTELVAVLSAQWEAVNGVQPMPLSFANSFQARASMGGRLSTPPCAITKCPADELTFVQATPEDPLPRGAPFAAQKSGMDTSKAAEKAGTLGLGGVLNLKSPTGITQETAEGLRARRAERQQVSDCVHLLRGLSNEHDSPAISRHHHHPFHPFQKFHQILHHHFSFLFIQAKDGARRQLDRERKQRIAEKEARIQAENQQLLKEKKAQRMAERLGRGAAKSNVGLGPKKYGAQAEVGASGSVSQIALSSGNVASVLTKKKRAGPPSGVA